MGEAVFSQATGNARAGQCFRCHDGSLVLKVDAPEFDVFEDTGIKGSNTIPGRSDWLYVCNEGLPFDSSFPPTSYYILFFGGQRSKVDDIPNRFGNQTCCDRSSLLSVKRNVRAKYPATRTGYLKTLVLVLLV